MIEPLIRIICLSTPSPEQASLFAVNQVERSIDYDDCSGAYPDGRSTAVLVAYLSIYPAAGGLALTRAARRAGWILVRADCIGELSAMSLRTIHPWRVIYALRTRAHGGYADPTDPDRATWLREAAVTRDLVELEAPVRPGPGGPRGGSPPLAGW